MRIALVVWFEREATVKDRNRRQQAQHRPATTDEHLDAGAEHDPLAEIGGTWRQAVSTAQAGPDLRVMRELTVLGPVGHSEQAPQQHVELALQPAERPA